MGLGRGMRRTGAAICLLALAGCEAAAVAPPADAQLPPATPAPEISAESAELASYYGAVQAELVSQGLLRTDMGGTDAPFTEAMLARNFLRVAFYEEYDRTLGGVTRHEAPIPLTRWEVPVRVSLEFGPSVTAGDRAADRARIGAYLGRLQRLTGHPISLTESRPNVTIFIDDVDERRALGPQVSALMPELTPSQLASVTDMDRSTYCQVVTQSNADTSTYTGAVAVIPSEHPDLLFMSCVHEEIAQALGLPNDSGLARPSIFNDDQEFALLTRQDELMLKMLYAPELHPGMTEEEARPIVESLAAKLMSASG